MNEKEIAIANLDYFTARVTKMGLIEMGREEGEVDPQDKMSLIAMFYGALIDCAYYEVITRDEVKAMELWVSGLLRL